MTMVSRMRFGIAATLLAGALSMVSPVLAQPPGGGGFQMPPEMQAKIKAWQKWRESNKNVSNLSTMVMQIREIDKKPETQLDKKQSSTMLGIVNTWRNKPTMLDDQAKQVSKQIGSMLNEKQLKKMATIQPFGRGGRPGGGGGPGGGGPGGGGGARPGGAGGPGGRPGGGFTFPDPPKGGMNPFNPDTMPFVQMRPQIKKSMDEFTSSLQKRAKG